MSAMLRSVFASALAALSFSTAALAQAPALSFEIAVCDTPAARNEADHVTTLDRAIQSFTHGSYPALERHLPALRGVLESAPACYPEIERRDGVVYVRSIDEADGLAISVAISAAASELALRSDIRVVRNTYAEASLLLGAYAVEMRQLEEALRWLDRGLALQPRNESLTAEKLAALTALHRPADVHALAQEALNDPLRALTLDRARFLRISGIALIDLERLDEAEAALNDSIRLQPDNPIARSELEYIARLRAGGPRTSVTITSPNAPKPETQ